MSEKVKFNVTEVTKTNDIEEIRKSVCNIINKLMRNEFLKMID